MANYHYERLSGQDSTFLIFEGPNTHMHVAGVTLFESGPLATPQGGVDIERIRAYIASRLHYLPHYRQRIAFTPIGRHPVWIDDDRFNLSYHVRHTSLPRPGDERQLKQLSARIMSQQLDRGKPLWEAWVVEGLQGGRFAMLTKIHHCIIDGASGVDLLSVLMRPTPETDIEESPAWVPRPAPNWRDLLQEEIGWRVQAPLELVKIVRERLADPEQARADLTDTLGAMWDTLRAGLQNAPETPLNQRIGPHRRFDWLEIDLNEIKAIKNALGGTVNDVVLTVVSGAMRRFLERRRVNVDALDFRAVVPVSVRSAAERGTFGNRVSAWITSLPIQERDPRARLAKVQAMTGDLKESKRALGAEALTQVAEWLGLSILTLGVRLADRVRPYNLIVTNVPGPQFPFYLLGAKMLGAFPMVPLFHGQGLGVALFSYLGKTLWGFNADWDLVPDLEHFVKAVELSFRELQQAAHAPEPKPALRRKRTARRPRANGAAATL
jgi:WS/DGAT/MGAT family acyltransferase